SPALIVTALTLALIILLTQSLKFLELIIESGASSTGVWSLAFFAMPRFIEVILPIAMMISILFIYQKMNSDSELVVFHTSGRSPFELAKPALTIALITTFILLFITIWLSPKTLSLMNNMRDVIKAQYSTVFLKEGVFNSFGRHITVYIQNRNAEGEMEGLLIYDSRPENEVPNTVIAKKGVIVSSEEGDQVLVYDGSKQDINPRTGTLNNLEFERYSIDLPQSEAVRQRERDADERTFFELLHLSNLQDLGEERSFYQIELHRRVIGPFLSLSFAMVSLSFILLGPVSRRGNSGKISLAVASVIILQALYLVAFNLSQTSVWGLGFLYIIVFLPIFMSAFLLSSVSEKIRRSVFFGQA
ncbi:MAG: LptF/LptG family permease, partial [Pseudomonadota bacterium]